MTHTFELCGRSKIPSAPIEVGESPIQINKSSSEVARDLRNLFCLFHMAVQIANFSSTSSLGFGHFANFQVESSSNLAHLANFSVYSFSAARHFANFSVYSCSAARHLANFS